MDFRARIRDVQQPPDQTITLRQVNQPKQEWAPLNTMEMSHAATEKLSLFSIRTTACIFLKTAHVDQVCKKHSKTNKHVGSLIIRNKQCMNMSISYVSCTTERFYIHIVCFQELLSFTARDVIQVAI